MKEARAAVSSAHGVVSREAVATHIATLCDPFNRLYNFLKPELGW
jgi:hypothetical protein